MSQSRSLTHTPTPLATVSPRPGWLDAEVFPYRSRFMSVGAHRLHYVDVGRGPTLLFTHGSPTWSMMYRGVIEQLSARYRCIAVDLPGFGLSRSPLSGGTAFSRNAETLGRFVDQLGIDHATLVAHATAGPSALAMAAERTERFDQLVITNSFGWALQESASLSRIVRVVSSRPFAFVNRWLNFLPRVTARFGRRTSPMSPAERRALLGPYLDPQARRHLNDVLSSLQTNRDWLSSLPARLTPLADHPTLLLCGRHDNGTAAGFVDRWAQIFHDHTRVMLEESGHFPAEDQPFQYARALDQFASAPQRSAGGE